MFQLHADKSIIAVSEREPLVSGALNIYLCRFTFSEDWEGLDRTAVFSAGGAEVSVVLGPENQCRIPWEVLLKSSVHLYVGVRGTRNGETILPSVQTQLGKVLKGTPEGETQKEPTPGVYDQILSVANEARETADAVRQDAEDGRFDGPAGPPGRTPQKGVDYYTETDREELVQEVLEKGVSEDQVKAAVYAYLEENPVTSGIPSGGTYGQVLAKASDADNDLMWKDPVTYSEVSNDFGGKTVTIGGI